MAKNVSDDNFDDLVIKSDKPVVVDFWAEWCGPCRTLSPIIDEISNEMGDRLEVMKMNIDENPNIPTKFGIRSIPAMMVFKNGQQIDTKVGVLPKNTIIEWLDSKV